MRKLFGKVYIKYAWLFDCVWLPSLSLDHTHSHSHIQTHTHAHTHIHTNTHTQNTQTKSLKIITIKTRLSNLIIKYYSVSLKLVLFSCITSKPICHTMQCKVYWQKIIEFKLLQNIFIPFLIKGLDIIMKSIFFNLNTIGFLKPSFYFLIFLITLKMHIFYEVIVTLISTNV